jgi:hypothetical protein
VSVCVFGCVNVCVCECECECECECVWSVVCAYKYIITNRGVLFAEREEGS